MRKKTKKKKEKRKEKKEYSHRKFDGITTTTESICRTRVKPNSEIIASTWIQQSTLRSSLCIRVQQLGNAASTAPTLSPESEGGDREDNLPCSFSCQMERYEETSTPFLNFYSLVLQMPYDRKISRSPSAFPLSSGSEGEQYSFWVCFCCCCCCCCCVSSAACQQCSKT